MSYEPSPPDRPDSIRTSVEEGLRKAIMRGEFPPGTHLSDRLLCARFGASRSIVREAIRPLETEGLVVLAPHRGPFVASLSAAEAVQIYEVRGALEALAAQGFAERASEAERTELRRIFERLEATGATSGQEALLQLKRDFYAVLLRGARNAYAERLLGQMLNRVNLLRAASMSETGRLPHTIRELRRIVEAIEARDGEGAAAAAADHVRSALSAALRVLRSKE